MFGEKLQTSVKDFNFKICYIIDTLLILWYSLLPVEYLGNGKTDKRVAGSRWDKMQESLQYSYLYLDKIKLGHRCVTEQNWWGKSRNVIKGKGSHTTYPTLQTHSPTAHTANKIIKNKKGFFDLKVRPLPLCGKLKGAEWGMEGVGLRVKNEGCRIKSEE